MKTAHSTHPGLLVGRGEAPGRRRRPSAPAAASRSAAAVDGGGDLGVDRPAAEVDGQAEAHAGDVAVERSGQVERPGDRHDVGVVGTLRGGEEQAGVVGAAGQRAVVGDRVEQARAGRPSGSGRGRA